ncbi:MAG: hypothetical protein WCE44_11570 [Candidatus Velthaea sp.]|jgi:hypothetical protein
MGFIVCSVEPIEPGIVSVRRLRALQLAGVGGALAVALHDTPKAEDGTWALSARALLRRAEGVVDESHAIFFDFTPREPERIDLYALVEVTGRMDRYVTDLLLHFKLACQRRGTENFSGGSVALRLPEWDAGIDVYEHLLIQGGLSGGDWTWGDPQSALSVTKIGGVKARPIEFGATNVSPNV